MLFGSLELCYTVIIEKPSVDKPTQRLSLSFYTEQAARAEAEAIANAFDDAGILYDIDVYYMDVEHKTWLTGYCNVPAQED